MLSAVKSRCRRLAGARSSSRGCAGLGDRAAQSVEPGAGARADANARNPTIFVALDRRLAGPKIDLVPDQHLRDAVGADLGQHLVDLARSARRGRRWRRPPRAAAGRRARSPPAWRGTPRPASCGRSRMKPTVSDSTTPAPASGMPDAPRGGVERGEQLVGGVDAGAGQRVEQRRLAGVGVADQRHREHVAPRARARRWICALLLQLLQLVLAAP